MASAPSFTYVNPAVAQNAAPGTSASEGLAQALSPVGTVKAVAGNAVVTRVDGSTVSLTSDTPIYRGDILATRDASQVSINFSNNAEFFLGSKGRMLVESVAPTGPDQAPQPVYFVLHGRFGFSHRSESFSGDPGAIVRTPVATLQVNNGRVAGRAAAEAVENVFTLLRNPDSTLGFTRVLTAGAAIVLQDEFATAKVFSLFRPPVEVAKPDFAEFVELFGVAISNWTQSPALSPATGGEKSEIQTPQPTDGTDGSPGASLAPDVSFLPPAQVAALDGFVPLPVQGAQPLLSPIDRENRDSADNNDVDGAADPNAPLDIAGIARVSFPGVGETLSIAGSGGIDKAFIAGSASTPNNISIGPNANGEVVLSIAGGGTIKLNGIETLDLTLGSAGDNITIGDLSGTDISDNTVIVNGEGGNDVIDAAATGKRLILNGGTGDDTLTASTGNDTLNGDSGDDTLIGNAGNDTLDGGTGADDMTGGAGNDTYFVDNAGDTVTENAGGGADTVNSTIAFTLGADVENLTLLDAGGAINGTGNAAANTLTRNSSINTLTGGGGNDTLDGGGGLDTLVGETGDDTYTIDNAGVTVTENPGEGTDLVNSSVSHTLATNVENLTLTGSDNIDGTGNAGANTLTGNSGNNTLDGAGGADTLIGGAGDDTYVVDDAGDTLTENALGGTDQVNSSITFTLGTDFENLTLIGGSNIDGTGNAADNTITGNAGNNILDGGASADTLIGGGGDDTYVVDDVLDDITEIAAGGTDQVNSSVTYTLADNVDNLTLTGSSAIDGTGNADANVLTGNSGDNILTGNGGNDTLDGGGGTDTLIGGAGDDTYIIDSAGVTVTENPGGGNADQVNSSATFTLSANVENLTLTGNSAIDGTGNADANVLTGNSGNNTLDGGAGTDTLIGGAGDDTYIVDETADVITENNAGDGTDQVNSSATFTLSANVENLTLTGNSAIDGTGNADANVLTGNSGANILIGNGGNDTLDGSGGADDMRGGTGDDTYTVDNVGDVITEIAAEGTDQVNSSVTYTLAANVDHLTLTGSSNIDGTGNADDNTIIGNSGNNTLIGGEGADNIQGGLGTDTVSYVTSGAAFGVTVNLTTGLGSNNDAEGDSYTGIENITGGLGVDFLTGDNGNNILIGGAGGDTLVGGIGVNSGNDTASYAGTINGGVNANLTTGTGTAGDAGGDTFTNIENLTGGDGADTLTGDGNANVLSGGAGIDTLVGNGGDDTLDGGAGADIMDGGAGADTYIVDDVGDVVLDTGVINDGIQSSVTYSLVGTNVESMTLSGNNAIDATGSSVANILTGNNADNTISGLAGDDTITAIGGNDILIGGAGGDSLDGGTGTDTASYAGSAAVKADLANSGNNTGDAAGDSYTSIENLTGGAGNDTLVGDANVNTLSGGAGIDIITGGGGADVLIGDGGDDIFYFELSNQGAGIQGFDTDNDEIQVRQAGDFALAVDGTNNNFSIINDAGGYDNNGTSDASTNDQAAYIFNQHDNSLIFDADGNGAGVGFTIATVAGDQVVGTDIMAVAASPV